MTKINVTELRKHLPKYLSHVKKGTEILVTIRGHVIARILLSINTKRNAKRQIKELRKYCKIGDVISPIK